MRTINMFLTEEQIKARQALGCGYEFEQALLYLVLWNMFYPLVHIYADGPRNMLATYSEHGNNSFTIGVVWSEADDEYTFHS